MAEKKPLSDRERFLVQAIAHPAGTLHMTGSSCVHCTDAMDMMVNMMFEREVELRGRISLKISAMSGRDSDYDDGIEDALAVVHST